MFKKIAAVVLSFALLGTMLTFPAAGADEKYEFEDGVITGTLEIHTDSTGAEGVAIKETNQTATVTIDVPEEGMYNVIVACAGLGGSKLIQLSIDGVATAQFSSPEVSEYSEVKVLTKLTAGTHDLTISAAWTWFAVDYVRIEPAEVADISGATTIPSNPNATAEAKALMAYLGSVYGKNIISGQQEGWGSSGTENAEFKTIMAETGELPAIRGFEYGNYNPLFGYEDDTNKRMIAWVNGNSDDARLDEEYWPGNGIATLCNHLPVPKDFENYVLGSTIGYEKTSFYVYDQSDTSTNKVSWLKGWDTANAVVEGTKEYDYYILCLDYMAEKLQELEDNNVPVLFRPLHEAEGSGGLDGSGAWFWWGAGGAEVFKDLWILTYEYLTETKGLDNLIWELNLYPYDTSYEWYPGDEYVDIAGFDKYSCTNWNDNNRSAATSTFYTIVEMLDSKKMVGMFENDAIPSLANLVDEKAYWLYFCPWYTTHLTHYNGDIETPAYKSLKEIYASDYCITLDELPDWKNFDAGEDPITTTTAETTAATTPPTTSETTAATTSATTAETTALTTIINPPVAELLGDVNDDKRAGTLADVIVFGKYLGGKIDLTDTQKLNADCYATPGLDSNDLMAVVMLSFGETIPEMLPLSPPSAE